MNDSALLRHNRFRTNTNTVLRIQCIPSPIQSGVQESPRKVANNEFQAENRLMMTTERHRTRVQSRAVTGEKGVLEAVWIGILVPVPSSSSDNSRVGRLRNG